MRQVNWLYCYWIFNKYAMAISLDIFSKQSGSGYVFISQHRPHRIVPCSQI